MGVMTISVDDETEAKFRKAAAERHNGRKGYLGDAITEAMNKWLEKKEQKRISEEAISLMEKGFNMGKKLYKNRDDLYERA